MLLLHTAQHAGRSKFTINKGEQDYSGPLISHLPVCCARLVHVLSNPHKQSALGLPST